MRLFHFGRSDAPLFGAYHPSRAPGASLPGVVLCAPFGDEAIRAHRPFFRLADRLSLIGVPSLRFDYYGTGDSAGEGDEISLTRWEQDVQLATQTLINMSGISAVILLGVRLGALVASRAARLVSPDGLVLWDPISSGQAYWDEVTEQSLPSQAGGFVVPPSFYDQIAACSEDNIQNLSTPRLWVIADDAKENLYANTVRNVTCLAPPDSFGWTSDDAMNSFQMPARTIDAIVKQVASVEWGGR